MKNAMKLFFIATLALMTVACSKKENDLIPEEVPTTQQTQSADGITITAQLAPKGENDATRALVEHSSYIEAKWAVDEHLAILYEVSGTKYAADARIIAVDGSTGAATIEFTVEAGTADDTSCTLVYPYSAANDEHDGLKALDALLGAQDGTLNANLDIRVGEGTIHTTTPGLSVTTQPEAQYAIVKVRLRQADGESPVNVNQLTITTGGQNFVITPASATSELFAALPALKEQAVSFMTTGTDNQFYYKGSGEVTLEAGKFYRSIIKMVRQNTIDLSTVTDDFVAQDGDVLTGTLTRNVKISIAEDATVTLNGVSINADGAWSSLYETHAGLTCEGNATIILMDGTTNTVKGFYKDYPGIFIYRLHKLTIKGKGTLNASSNGSGAGIGGGDTHHCGQIEIQDGTINATGGTGAAGIGGGKNAEYDNITISGGNVTATGGYQSPGIGSGSTSQNSQFNDITISGGNVTATGGYQSPGIGAGYSGECRNITIGGNVGVLNIMRGEGSTVYDDCIGKGLNGNCGTITIFGVVYESIKEPAYKYVPGFTVNGGGTQVHFAPGNLQAYYNGYEWRWRFAEHQWTYIGNNPGNTLFVHKTKLTLSGVGAVDLLCWSMDIYSVKDSYGIHTICNPPYDKKTDTLGFIEWGDLWISNYNFTGAWQPGTWRTPSHDEWHYLFYNRANAGQKYASATVHGIHGIVLLPDIWTLPAGCSFIAGMGGWNRNVYTDAQWDLMETYGAVFLPAAGMRDIAGDDNSYMSEEGAKGYYWSSTRLQEDWWTYEFEFNGNRIKPDAEMPSLQSYSVRLVK